MEIKIPRRPTIWHCPICGKWDTPENPKQMATPEHRSYRGIDIGDCKGDMISLYSREAIQKANE